MKLSANKSPNTSGSALVMTMVITGSIGMALASYLFLVGETNKAVMRSMAWNSAMPMIEAGIEEAMAHINKNGMTNLYHDGWRMVSYFQIDPQTLISTPHFMKERKISDGYYRIFISQTAPPVLISAGYARVPLKPQFLPPRAVRVNTRREARFARGMVAKGGIDLRGNNVTTDSFDSQDPAKSTVGRYDPAKAQANGDIASNANTIGVIDQGNADVYGHIATGPGGTINLGPQGAAGSKAWIDSGKSGIEPGYASDDMNVDFPDVTLPFTSGFSGVSGTPLRINNSGNYMMDTLSKSLIVRAGATAVLIVNSRIQLTGLDSITIESGASLKIYMRGEDAFIGGKGVVNDTGNALNFMYYGLPTNTALTFAGNGEFVGTIYAPQAAFSLKGGGVGIQDFVGASVTDSVTMTGNFNFHYDENLGRNGPDNGFTISSWNEI